MRKPGSAYKDPSGGSKCLQDEAKGRRRHLGEGCEKYQGKRCRDIERKREKESENGNGSWEWELGSGCAALTEGILFTRGWYAKVSDRGGLGGSERDSEKGDSERVTNAENTRRRE